MTGRRGLHLGRGVGEILAKTTAAGETVTIKLDQANRIIAVTFERGAELNLKPLSVAVLDLGGHVIAFQRQDKASFMRFEIAAGKACGALALGMSSRAIGAMAQDRPSFVASLASIAPAGIIPTAGGVIVVDCEGAPIGAVGATGDTSENDEVYVLAGIAAAGLRAQV